MKWYTKNFRRHLCDMHIADWDDRFLSEFSVEDYFQNLKNARVTAAMIYFQSHAGLCNYPTESGKMHNAFKGREDEVKKLVDLCRENGIAVIGYYSLVYNTWAADTHPEWRLIHEDGGSNRTKGSRYGLCCPNNPEYRQFTYNQIKEMSEIYKVDGMFYDMPFWPVRCYCEHCKKRYAEEVGGEIPKRNSPDYNYHEYYEKFIRRSREWMGEFSEWATRVTNELMPGVTVEQNCAHGALPVHTYSHLTTKACDYAGGDLHKDAITNSFACKYYYSATNNQPFEYMLSRCAPNLQAHTITKSRDLLESYVMLTCAHHGATLMIDAIDPVGTLNPKFYNFLGEIFDKEIPYEKYLTEGKMLTDVGVFFHYDAKFSNLQGQQHSNYNGSVNAVKQLVRRHIPVGVIASENIKKNELNEYGFIVLSNMHHLTKEMREDLIKYVNDGGTLYMSNIDERELAKELLGITCEGYTEECKTYIGAEPQYEELLLGYDKKYPLPFNCRLPIVKGYEEKDVAARIVLPYILSGGRDFASIHSNPPGEVTENPALIIKKYGKGTVIWSAAPIETGEELDYSLIIENLVSAYARGGVSLKTDAHPSVELVTFRDEKTIRISGASIEDSDFATTFNEFNVSVKVDKEVEGVYLLPDETPIPFTEENGFVSFKTRALRIFDMYEIRLK